MGGEKQEDPDEQELGQPIEVDYAAGIALCVLAGMSFAAVVSGWLLIFADLTELRSRLDRIQAERTWQVSDMGKALRGMEIRIEAVSDRLQKLQQAAHGAGDDPAPFAPNNHNQDNVPDAQSVLDNETAPSFEKEAH